jgi:hypothetical protein
MSRTQRLTEDLATPRRDAISLIEHPRSQRNVRAWLHFSVFIPVNRIELPADEAGGRNRTDVPGLEGRCSTTELHPRAAVA